MPLTKTTFLIFFTASKSLPLNSGALYRIFLLLAVANMPGFPFPSPPFLSPLFIPYLPSHSYTPVALLEPSGFNLNPFSTQSLRPNKNHSWNPSKSIPFLPTCFYLPSSTRCPSYPKVESKIESTLDFSLFPAILKKPQILINTKDSRQIHRVFATFHT